MDSPNPDRDAAEPTNSRSSQEAGPMKFPKLVAFRDLCRCGDEVWIENEGQIYRLRRTKLGKLILTK